MKFVSKLQLSREKASKQDNREETSNGVDYLHYSHSANKCEEKNESNQNVDRN